MRRTGWLFGLLAALLVAGAAQFQRSLDETRFRILPRTQAYKDLPPELVITTAMLGGFRGVLIDVLWVRAISLKQEGRFFEMVQLYDWIGTLEPRFDQVWVYGMWDMAYNVSVELPPGPDRWRWVNAGLDFGRQGLRYNPKSHDICYQMAWIYWHKIGQFTDDSHKLYKKLLFQEMERVVGDSSPAEITALRDALRDADATESDPKVLAILREFRARRVDPLAEYGRVATRAETLPPAARDYYNELRQKKDPDAERLFRRLRARVLKEQYGLDPDRMLAAMAEYGPLDWRTPYAPALYFGELSVLYAERNQEDFRTNFDRMKYMALQELVAQGRFFVTPDGLLVMSPDYRFAKALHALFQVLIPKYGGEGNTGMQSGHSNFITRMVFDEYLLGNREESLWWFRELKRLYEKDLRLTYDEFIRQRLREWLVKDMSPERAVQGILGLYHQHFMARATGAEWSGDLLERKAKFLHDACREQYKGTEGDPEGNRMKIEPLPELRKQVLRDLFSGAIYWPPFLFDRLKTVLGDEAKEYAPLEKNRPREPAEEPDNPVLPGAGLRTLSAAPHRAA